METPEDYNPARTAAGKEDPPPFLGTWNRMYGSIVLYTCALILILYLMTVALNR